MTRTDTDFTQLTVDANGRRSTITGTQNHPYYDLTRHAFVNAAQLAAGDRLQTTGSAVAMMAAVRNYTGSVVTYDLTIDGVHTYYVIAGSTPVLVRNSMETCSTAAFQTVLHNEQEILDRNTNHLIPGMDSHGSGLRQSRRLSGADLQHARNAAAERDRRGLVRSAARHLHLPEQQRGEPRRLRVPRPAVVLHEQDRSGARQMNLTWSGEEYDVTVESAREHQLVRDSAVEAAYIVDGLPDAECVARFGRTKAEMQRFIDGWGLFRPSRRLPVQDLEFVRLCFLETLDFFSDAEYESRTGWPKQDASRVLSALLMDRRRITISRQWG